MIAVAGLNSAVDRLVEIEALTPGLVLRAREAHGWPGGKGVHVATAAAALGEMVRLTGFMDDAHRDWFAAWLRARGVDFHPIHVPTAIRTCLAIREAAGRTTEILEAGPTIESAVREAAFDTVVNVCRTATVAVLTGSLPPGMPADAYSRVVAALPDTRVIVDASGELLRQALAARPFAIKPNRQEAEAAAGIRIDSVADAAAAVRILSEKGVALAIISLGADGAVAWWNGRVCHAAAQAPAVANEVGAGDCLVGAIAAAIARGDDIFDAIRLGVAAGTAKVLSPDTGAVRRTDIDALLPTVRVSRLF
jgi:1-phosphofructokinase family hexose kinase